MCHLGLKWWAQRVESTKATEGAPRQVVLYFSSLSHPTRGPVGLVIANQDGDSSIEAWDLDMSHVTLRL